MKRALLILALSVCFSGHARAYLLTEDIPNLTNNIISEIKNYAQIVQQTWNQVTQINNQITQINNQVTQIQNQVTQLARIGNPQTYINVLHLADFMATASALAAGIGNTLTQIRAAANGVAALGYTGNGIYSNLSNTLDRFGNPVQYTTDNFRKFDAVNQSYTNFDASLRTYNQQAGSLQSQITAAMNNANGAGDLITSIKHLAHLVGIGAQINALGNTAILSGQRLTAQHQMNQNDAARGQEAQRQQQAQERQTDLKQMASRWGQWVGGTGSTQTSTSTLP